MISIRNLSKRYGDFEALHHIDLTVSKGEFVVILGASGAGKSTLLRCINQLTEPTTGEIRVDGVESSSDRPGLRRLRRDVAMIFQHYNVVPRLSVLKKCADRTPVGYASGSVMVPDVSAGRHKHRQREFAQSGLGGKG